MFHEEEVGELLAKNIARTARRQPNGQHHAIWRIFAELNNPLSPKLAYKQSMEVGCFSLFLK